jgi:hypothetical protein
MGHFASFAKIFVGSYFGEGIVIVGAFFSGNTAIALGGHSVPSHQLHKFPLHALKKY